MHLRKAATYASKRHYAAEHQDGARNAGVIPFDAWNVKEIGADGALRELSQSELLSRLANLNTFSAEVGYSCTPRHAAASNEVTIDTHQPKRSSSPS